MYPLELAFAFKSVATGSLVIPELSHGGGAVMWLPRDFLADDYFKLAIGESPLSFPLVAHWDIPLYALSHT